MKLRKLGIVILASLITIGILSERNEVKAVCAGQTYTPVFFAKESLTVSTTAIGGTPSVYNPTGNVSSARYAFISVETNPLRYWLDGSTPTASLGHLVNTNGNFEVCGVTAVKNFLMIRQGAADSTTMISYGR